MAELAPLLSATELQDQSTVVEEARSKRGAVAIALCCHSPMLSLPYVAIALCCRFPMLSPSVNSALQASREVDESLRRSDVSGNGLSGRQPDIGRTLSRDDEEDLDEHVTDASSFHVRGVGHLTV